jgi:hypothetical protein
MKMMNPETALKLRGFLMRCPSDHRVIFDLPELQTA